MNLDPSQTLYNELREEFEKRMINEGYRIVYPKDNELQIDIDNEDQMAVYKTSLPVLEGNRVLIQNSVETVSKGGGTHITLTLPFDVDSVTRIAFQAALGSDPVRELLSLLRFLNKDIHPTLFVEKEEAR